MKLLLRAISEVIGGLVALICLAAAVVGLAHLIGAVGLAVLISVALFAGCVWSRYEELKLMGRRR